MWKILCTITELVLLCFHDGESLALRVGYLKNRGSVLLVFLMLSSYGAYCLGVMCTI
jgi:hypothetical protein